MAVFPTRRPLLGRLVARLRCAYTRWLIRCAEHDMARHRAEFEHASRHLPRQIDLDRKHIDTLTRRLVREDRDT